MFEKNLADMIRGLRNNKKDEGKYINVCLEEIKKEVRSTDIDIKANAITKLQYIQMLGYDIGWASFHVIEVMSSNKFIHKRVGYMTACRSFGPHTDVLMLATNLIKKDLASSNQFESGIALNGLSHFVTPDLARDLSSDVVSLMNSSRPYIRKKATLTLYKIFLQFPEALRPSFPRLREKLDDEDVSVVTAAVNVICELARKNPKNYLPLAPQLFKIMTNSSSNWMLIKVIKLFAVLTPLEPRLGKKLVEPITNIINTTPAMSLLYECINTVTTGMLEHESLVRLCIAKLRNFVEDPDQNLKYLGLIALGRVIKDYAKMVAEYKEVIIKCLDDQDLTIRMRSLDILSKMVSKKNLMDIVKKMMSQLEDGTAASQDNFYREEIVKKIISMCSTNSYQFVTDFEWYITTLVELSRIDGIQQAKEIAEQLMDVSIRVKVVRPFSVGRMVDLLGDSDFLNKNPSSLFQIIEAAAWISGEYSSFIEDHYHAEEILVQPAIKLLPGNTQAVIVQNLLKIAATNKDEEQREKIATSLLEKVHMFTHSTHLETQERSSNMLEILKIAQENNFSPEIMEEIANLFDGELNPVASKAQKKVPLPEGIDLDEWIFEPLPEEEPEEKNDFSFISGRKDEYSSYSNQRSDSEDEETKERKREERIQRRKHDPFYLSDSKKKTDYDVDSIPIVKLTDDDLHSSSKDDRRGREKESRERRKEREKPKKNYEVDRGVGEMPEGASLSDEEKDKKKTKKTSDPMDIDLFAPVTENEQLPTLKAYDSPMDLRKREEKAMQERIEKQAKEAKEAKEREERRKRRDDRDKERSSRDKDGERRDRDRDRDRNRKDKDSERDKGKEIKKDDKKDDKKSSKDAILLEFDDLAISKPQEEKPKEEKKKEESREKDRDRHRSDRDRSDKDRSDRDRSDRHRSDRDRDKSDKDRSDKDRSDKDRSDRHRTDRDKEGHRSKRYDDLKDNSTLIHQGSSSKLLPTNQKILGSDSRLNITYKLSCSATQANEVQASLTLTNIGDETISSIEVNLIDTLNLKLLNGKNGVVPIPFSLRKGEFNTTTLRFNAQNILTPQFLKGSVNYSCAGSNKFEIKINFPCSSFVLDTKCSKSQFVQMLSDSSQFDGSESRTFETPQSWGLDKLADSVCKLLNVGIVEKLSSAVSFYGCTIQDHHVAILLKKKDEKSFSVDLKCSEQHLATNLTKELEEFFK